MRKLIVVAFIFTLFFSYKIGENIVLRKKHIVKQEENWLLFLNTEYLWYITLLVLVSIMLHKSMNVRSIFTLPTKLPDFRDFITIYCISLYMDMFILKDFIFSATRKEFIQVSLLGPIAEEILFRGLLLPLTIILLEDVLSISFIIVINSLLFAVHHFFYFRYTFKEVIKYNKSVLGLKRPVLRLIKDLAPHFISNCVIGYVFIMATYTTDSIIFSLIYHILINFTYLLAVKYNQNSKKGGNMIERI